eukprot:CAMPEP_0198694372 /NCGR_PEP_ID=MMETSP1468-20131203/268226_1 /TAXON_ID=1461545 /ORGANISM="Mantoniella sp, Strain CCMP1436" /LENGTH=88 /DNA_ID=CAMNT_0044449511 /DNA_START=641 /DNA_END=904 /DNA_ORIENTATION=+
MTQALDVGSCAVSSRNHEEPVYTHTPTKIIINKCVPFSASPLPTSLPPSTPSIARAYAVGKHQSLQTSPGVYHEPLFAGLDWVIQQAG